MNLKQVIDQDLKQALLGGDRLKSDTLRVIKSVILNEEIALKKRDLGLSNQEIISCLQKESKKRQEAADLYTKANSLDRAEKELTEKKIIEAYLPVALSESELVGLIDEVIGKYQNLTPKDMGVIIGQVKKESEGRADGATIARLVKSRFEAVAKEG